MFGINKRFYFPIFLVIYEMAVYLSNDMYLPALKEIGTIFQANDFQLQWTIIIWIVGSAILLPILGPISDHYGQRKVILYGGIVFLIGAFGCAFATSMNMFLLMRFLQGTAVCSIMIAGYGAIHENFDGKEVIVILSRMVIIAVISPMVGPLIGGYLLLIGDWSISFKLVGVLAAAVLIGLYRTMPESKHHSKQLELGSIFRHYRTLMQIPNFIWGSLGYGFVFSCLIIWITVSPLLLMEFYQLSPEAFGWSQIPIFASFSVGAFFIQRLLHFGWKPVSIVTLGLSLMFVGTSALLYVALFREAKLWEVLTTLAIVSFGKGFIVSPMNRLVLSINASSMGIRTSFFNIIATGIVTATSFAMSLFYDSEVKSFSWGVWITVSLACGSCWIFKHMTQTANMNTIPEKAH